MTENANTENIATPVSASERAGAILLAERHKDSERYLVRPIVITYKSTFLPDGSNSVCFTFEQLDRHIAALVFASNGDEKAKADLYEYFDRSVELLTDPDFTDNACHYGYTKMFGAFHNMKMETEYDMYNVFRDSSYNPMPHNA